MKIKVSETTRLQLDWLVAKCEGKNGILHDDGIVRCIVVAAASGVYKGTFKPTINPAQGQPILEREHIHTGPHTYGPTAVILNSWHAVIGFDPDNGEHLYEADGATMLIAGLRCYVASKLGDEVEVPEELL